MPVKSGDPSASTVGYNSGQKTPTTQALSFPSFPKPSKANVPPERPPDRSPFPLTATGTSPISVIVPPPIALVAVTWPFGLKLDDSHLALDVPVGLALGVPVVGLACWFGEKIGGRCPKTCSCRAWFWRGFL